MRQAFKFLLVFAIGIALGRLWEAGELQSLAKSIESAARETIAAAGAPDIGPIVVIEELAPTATLSVAATATPVIPADTLVPPTAAPVSATIIAIPPTATFIPPTAMPVTPPLTAVPPIDNTVMPSATSIPPTHTPEPPIPATQLAYPLESMSPPITRQTRDVVNLRLGPGTSYDKAGTLPANATVQIIGLSGDWYQIIHDGRELFVAGWLTSDMPTMTATAIRRPTSVRTPTPRITLRRFASPQRKYVHGSVNLRQGPGTNYAKAGSVAAGASLQILGRSGDWYLLRHGGREVYIATWLTHDSPPPPTARPQLARQQQQPVQQQPAQQPVQQPVQQQPSFSCNCSKTCGQMSSCREAYFQLNNCGCRRRDSDKDGIPCESICR